MKKKTKGLKLSTNISRRDFVNGTLVGAGAALLSSAAPVFASTRKPVVPPQAMPAEMAGKAWNGYAGVGDYARSNGNVASTRDAAHLIRDGFTDELMETIEDTGEVYDLVVIGGGFSGMGAAYQFKKDHGDTKKCLVLENHPVFGGEAKQNEFEVDGYKLYGPQGSNGFFPPDKDGDGLITQIYKDTGLPFDFDFLEPDTSKTNVRAPQENYFGMFWEEERYDTGYFMGADAETPWVINPREDNFARMPWSMEFKAELNKAFEDKNDHFKGADIGPWLDSMTYKDLLEIELGYSPEVTKYFDPIIAISMGGVGADVYSAYSAHLLDMPGTQNPYKPESLQEKLNAYSFPGGNSAILRHVVKYLIPASITGGNGLEEIIYNDIDFEALDKTTNPISIRLNSTAINISHEGDPDTAEYVNVTYAENGKIKRVKAKGVAVSIGGWVAKHIVSDMPEPIYEAYSTFYHSPVLVVNVAVRNWRFLDKLGISSGRWFEGFGDFFSIRRPMITGDKTLPFDPNKPAVMTFYVPFNNPGYSEAEQGVVSRNELLSKSYADYESEIIDQMTKMFGMAGFDAERDIAAIVLNRWGHAYLSPQPGFHFGKDGKEAPKDIVKHGFGRIQFGHSELSGYMNHTNALSEGARAAHDVMKKI